MAIIEEGLRQRNRAGVVGWICASCQHYMTLLSLEGTCANCKKNTVLPVKSRERMREETESALDQQRWKPQQKEFDPFDPVSQIGRPLTHQQLTDVIKQFIPGLVSRPVHNGAIKRNLMALYVPNRGKVEESATEYEITNNLRHVCNCEQGMMPEWDIMRKDEKGLPLAMIRGWRSVLAAFYRAGLMPFTPDDGRRKSNWEIKNSPFKEKRF